MILAALAATLASCSQKEDYDLSWLDEMGAELPQELDSFNTEYRLEMTNSISEVDYLYDGDASLETSYTETGVEQAMSVSEYLEQEIFPLFPDTFISRYMPARIYVADDVAFSYSVEVYDYEDGKMKHSLESMGRQLYGEIGQKHLTLAASRLENKDADEGLKFEWTSLILERMMSNINIWKEPTDFINIAEDRVEEFFGPYSHYYKESLTANGTTLGMPGSPDKNEFSIWYYCGAIRHVRYDFQLEYTYTAAFNNSWTGSDGGYTEDETHYIYSRPTWKQDFADFIAYWLVYGEDGWETLMQRIDGLSYVDEDTDDDGNVTSVTYTCSREIFEERMDIVCDYMSELFGWDFRNNEESDNQQNN